MRQKIEKEEKSYLELKAKVKVLIASVSNIELLSNRDLNVILKFLKQKDDKKLPTKKKNMIEIYHKLKHCEPRKFRYCGIGLTTVDTGNNNEEVCNEEIMNECVIEI